RPGQPQLRPGLRGAAVGGADDRLVAQRSLRGVLEGADHRGNVAQRRAPAAPLRKRPGRVALEVEHHEVLAGVEELPEMVAAVDPAALRGQAVLQERLEALVEGIGAGEELLGKLDHLSGHLRGAKAQLAQDAPGEVALALVDAALIEGGIRIEPEPFLGAGGESEVQLRGALPQEARRRQGRGEQLARDRGRLHGGEIEEPRLRRPRRRPDLPPAGERILVEAAQLLAHELPGRPLADDESVQRRESDGLAASGAVLDRSEERRHRRLRRAFCQVAAQLELGADPYPEPPVDLEEELVAEADRRVPVVATHELGLERTYRNLTAQRGGNDPNGAPRAVAAAQRFQGDGGGPRVDERIEEPAGGFLAAPADAQSGDDGLRRPLAQKGPSLGGIDRQGNDVVLGFTESESHPHQRQAERAQRNDVAHAGVGEFAVAAGEPAAALDPGRQRRLEDGPVAEYRLDRRGLEDGRL